MAQGPLYECLLPLAYDGQLTLFLRTCSSAALELRVVSCAYKTGAIDSRRHEC